MANTTETAGASNAMEVRIVIRLVNETTLAIVVDERKLEIDHQRDIIDIDATCAHVGHHEHTKFALAKPKNDGSTLFNGQI